MMCLVTGAGRIERMNRAMAAMVGPVDSGGEQGVVSCLNALQLPGGCGAGPQCEKCPLRLAIKSTMESGVSTRQLECVLRLKRDAGWHEVAVSASTARVEVAGGACVLVCLEEVRQRQQLEAQRFQARKMEAIGQLAGWVAHDFNDILSTMIMNLSLLHQSEHLKDEAKEVLEELDQATQRAAGLSRQLLLFGRRQLMQRRRLDLNEVVAGLLMMLRRLAGEQVDVIWKGGGLPLWVEGDRAMLEQVLMNLCLNARDAMPRGGRVSLRGEVITVTIADVQQHHDRLPGAFVRVSFEDTGPGMDPALLQRIFEPFFTTKELGWGTGLGLAAVYGIVKQHQGWIEAHGGLGRGTTFVIYLPEAAPAVKPAASLNPGAAGGGETILVVEDDSPLRELIVFNLERFGYRVLSAGNGPEALRNWEQEGGAIDLLFTDMVMPEGMTGLELVARLRQQKPALKVIISSGYSLDLHHAGAPADESIRFLAKPYKPVALARLVRQCLDEATPTSRR